jgi:pilus assembly protein CpaF
MSSLDRILPFLVPIQHLLTDPSITEVMVNAGGKNVFVEQRGELLEVADCSVTESDLLTAIKSIARHCGDDVTTDRPYVDARLEDGSRIAAMIRPCSVDGPTLTIRRFGRRYSLLEMVDADSLSPDDARQLIRWIQGGKNILISGGTGTGKTTLLNALAAHIPDTDRIVLLEDTAEIHITKPNLVRFEVRRASDTAPAITMADLLRATLRHRPDRIIVGEVRGNEAADLLQALNTGHRGSMTTIHANSAVEALTRLTHLVLAAGRDLPDASVREAVASAVQIVVHIERRGRLRTIAELITVDGYNRQSGQWVYSPVHTSMEVGAA